MLILDTLFWKVDVIEIVGSIMYQFFSSLLLLITLVSLDIYVCVCVYLPYTGYIDIFAGASIQ